VGGRIFGSCVNAAVPAAVPMSAIRPMLSYTLAMGPARAELARQVLDLLRHSQPVPMQDALQLRNWAVHPDDAMLSLEEIAYRILKHEDQKNARAAEQ
jgi:hypothetical protein